MHLILFVTCKYIPFPDDDDCDDNNDDGDDDDDKYLSKNL